ncbi:MULTISPECIES: hypothetical protein [unclassified Isoptericola]|uniref:hypothetical protein n=1 Tax=unclassified Isoptericola TaxID=2623355 RepID=UPI0027140F77|nr:MULTISPECIES: hypothetical protein [unclassified Isoptericola]MDO8143433.1 hypothetical protein [Isoptericola sp. 178]MDO8147296.1 hypothetical protein [Isoptericola sp. b515]MDO8150391.1 hypothetical protein [Isoptericola sp. b408]
MSWFAVFLLTTGSVVIGLAVRSWLRSDAHHDAVARRRRRRAGPDPLVTLAIQIRLGQLAEELRTVTEDPGLYARAHHWRAVQDAYDAMLRDACRVAGLAVVDEPLRPDERVSEDERLREELELSARGWSW